MAKKLNKDELHKQAMKRAKEAAQANAHNVEESKRDWKLLLGDREEHWGAQALAKRKNRPTLVINRGPAFVAQVVGDMRQNKIAAQVVGVDNKADPDTADIIEGLIRQQEYECNAADVFNMAGGDMVSGSYGYFRLCTEYVDPMSFDQKALFKHIRNPHSVSFDPASVMYDKSDARYCFVYDTMAKDEFEEKYPKKSTKSSFDIGSDVFPVTTSDGEERIQIAEYWYKKDEEFEVGVTAEGVVFRLDDNKDNLEAVDTRKSCEKKVYQCIVSGSEVLEGPHEFVGDFIPIFGMYGVVIYDDGKVYYKSLIRDARDPQRLLNYMRSASAETVGLQPKAPWVGTDKQFAGHPEWDDANETNYSKLTYNADPEAPGPPQRNFPGSSNIAAITESQMAAQDYMDVVGIHQAGLGAKSNETSGTAIRLRQTEGDVGTFLFIDNQHKTIEYAYRCLISIIPKLYDMARIIRIRGKDDAEDLIPINQPVRRVKKGMKFVYKPITEEEALAEPAGATRTFDMNVGKYDVRVKAGPSYTTQRQEAAEQLTQMLNGLGPEKMILLPKLFENMDWPGASEVADIFKKLRPDIYPPDDDEAAQGEIPQPPPDPEMVKAQAEQQKTQAELQIKAEELRIKQFEAETDRMEAEAKIRAMTMQDIQKITQVVEQVLMGQREDLAAAEAGRALGMGGMM